MFVKRTNKIIGSTSVPLLMMSMGCGVQQGLFTTTGSTQRALSSHPGFVESVSGYLHLLDTGYANAAEILDRVDHLLTPFGRDERPEREERKENEAANSLTLKQVAVS